MDARGLFQKPAYFLNMVISYLKNRALLYNTIKGQRRIFVTSGSSQGSILGSHLWNVSWDSLLRFYMSVKAYLVGYAVKFSTVIARRSFETANLKLDTVMRRVNTRMKDYGL